MAMAILLVAFPVAQALAQIETKPKPIDLGNTPDGRTNYDSNPNHLWNRLNENVFARTAPDGKQYGLNEMDILYWGTTAN